MFRLNEKIEKKEVYVIAEMSANHGGSIDNALEIVREAAKAGVDCVKIQTYTADTITINCDNEYFRINEGLWEGYSLYDLYVDAGTPWEWQARIKEECEKCGVDFLSTPFDNSAVDFLESIGCEAYKIASFELVDIPLIEYTASKGKPMIISCGMATVEEIEDALDACKRAGNTNVTLLKCCSDYPANWQDMHIANIRDMEERFGVNVGLSDHSEGSLAAVVAVACGAKVVEKHICLNKEIKSADSEFSMTVEAFEKMVKDIKAAKMLIGDVKYGPTENEIHNLAFRRSLFSVKDIKKGEIITNDNVRSIRPAQGLMPKHLKNVLGKKVNRDVSFGEPISLEMIEE